MPSNSALVRDVCAEALRAFYDAPQRGRQASSQGYPTKEDHERFFGCGWKFEPNDLAEINFPASGADVSFRLLQDSVVPRPVYLISTVSATAVNNVAPYSYVSPA